MEAMTWQRKWGAKCDEGERTTVGPYRRLVGLRLLIYDGEGMSEVLIVRP